VTEPSHAVFLSYASQDAEPAQKICQALRAAGIEVFLDQSELRGGDAWDQKIRHEIHDCALFIPMVSQHTQERLEGYFRHEWNLAIERTHHMAQQKPFLVPVVVDGTRDQEAFVPDAFRAVQWTRLPGGDTPPAFVERIKRLLSPELSPLSAVSGATAAIREPVRATWRSKPVLLTIVFVFAALAYFVAGKFWIPKPLTPAPAAFAPPPHSIAVLPFLDMSEKKDQEYFADGMAEELLDLLAQVPGLRVPARTSSFYFKTKSEDIATIAQKLRVAHLLEGSVRRAGNRIRVTAQLIRADDGYHLWSKTYDRDVKDTFEVQDAIAGAIVAALRITLDPARPVSNAHRSESVEAYRQYLLGKQLFEHPNKDNFGRAAAAYRQALLLDPGFAAAHAGLAVTEFDLGGESRAAAQQALLEAEKAVALAQGLAEAYSTRGFLRFASWDWTGSEADFDRANELDPNDSVGLRRYGELLGGLGRLPESIAVEKKAVDLDPLSAWTWQHLSRFQIAAGLLADARESAQHALEINPDSPIARDQLGVATLLAGDGLEATRAFGAHKVPARRLWGMALAEHALGHRRESQQALDQLITESGQDSAFEIAEVYAWRGEKDQAFAWLDKAYVQQRIGMCFIKANAFLKGLEADPRFRSLLRKMNLPE